MLRVCTAALFRIQHRTSVFFGQRVHARTLGKTQRILRATMQHDKERQAVATRGAARQIKPIAELEVPTYQSKMSRALRILISSLEKATDPRLAPPKKRCPGTHFLFEPPPHRRPHTRILRKTLTTVSNSATRNRRFETSGALVASNHFPTTPQSKRMPLRPITQSRSRHIQ